MPNYRRPLLLLSALAGLPACSGNGGESDSDTEFMPATPATIPEVPGTTMEEPTGAVTETSTGTGPNDPTTGETGTTDPTQTTDPVTSTTTTTTDSTTGGEPCVGLECQVPVCPNGGTTTLKGTVFAPEGSLPLYNVIVYVPNGPLDPITDGVTCDTCDTELTGDPIVAGLTDTKGEFVLEDVPAGANVPLVVTIGKWRREVVLPEVTPCAENLVDPALSRLPKNQSEGHIPRIAMVTGGADALECLLRKVGLDDAEFTPEVGPGRINMFAGDGGGDNYVDDLNDGAAFPSGQSLWNDAFKLKNYDMILMACEGDVNENQKSNEARQNIVDYAGVGGRLFLSHWHNVWIEDGAGDWPTAAEFDHQDDLNDPFTAKIETGFPKGMALAEWLVNVGGSDNLGEIVIKAGQNTVKAVNEAVATRWIYGENPTSVQYFTFNAPIGAPEAMQCGRVVDTDIHVSSGDEPGQNFPAGCDTQDLSPQEKALIFMFFELSSCLIPDDEPPIIPG